MIEAALYGLVQGLTEFLPISSTAHLRLLPVVLGKPDPGAAFTAVIQLGTLLAVLLYFRQDLTQSLVGWVKSLGARDPEARRQGRLGWAIAVGTVPIVVFGLLLEDHIKGGFRSLYVIAGSLIVMGAILWVADRRANHGERRCVADGGWLDGLKVGLWQAIALVPGASRSGSSISGALFAGFDRASAARFSFLLSVPSILAAGLKELWDTRELILGEALAPVLVATAVSFLVGYASIAFLLRFIQTRSLGVFVVYRFALGVLLLVLLQAGVVSP